MKSATLILSVVLVLMSAITVSVYAHGTLEVASPRADETFDVAPREIRLEFNELLESTFSTIKLTDPQGSDAANLKTAIDTANMKVMHASLPALAADKYNARWIAMTRDGHKTKGAYSW